MKTPRTESAACAWRSFLPHNVEEMRSFRLKLERRRQTSVHLGFGLSKGGLDAVICGGSGANAPWLFKESGHHSASCGLGSRANNECSF